MILSWLLSCCSFLGEESGLTLPSMAVQDQPPHSSPSGASLACWIVDPIDGTTNFVHRLPHACISIALVQDQTPLFGLVYNLITGDLFTAIQGQGAYLNRTQRLYVSKTTQLSSALVATEFGGSEWRYPESIQGLLTRQRQQLTHVPVQGIRCLGSAALTLCYVAAGTFDVYYQYSIHSWDIAAGLCILHEAGGYVSPLIWQMDKGTGEGSTDDTIKGTTAVAIMPRIASLFSMYDRNLLVTATSELQDAFHGLICSHTDTQRLAPLLRSLFPPDSMPRSDKSNLRPM